MAVPVYTINVSVAIVSSSVANPSVITTATPHGITTGATVTISGHTSVTPDINGAQVATVTGATTFTIPVNVTDGGVGGRVTVGRSIRLNTFEINATESQPDSARFAIIAPDAVFRVAKGSEVTAYEDSAGLFGGIVTRVREVGLGGHGGAAIVNEIECVSFKRYADYRYVTETFAAQILKTTLTTIVNNYLDDFGVTLHGSQVNGPSLAALDVQHLQCTALLNQLAELSGYTWNIDHEKKLRFTAPGSTAAPYDVTTANGKALDTEDVTVESSEQNYANRILVKAGGDVVVQKTDTFTGNGVQTAFVLTHQAIGPLNLRGYVTNGGVFETLGTGATWSYATATNTITRTSAPANLNSIVVVYDVQFPITVTVEDTGEQTTRGYIVERIVAAPDVYDATVATAIGTVELAKAIAQAKTVRYVTLSAGAIRPGQSQTLTFASRNVSGTYTVTEVRTVNHAGNSVRRYVTAVEGTTTAPEVYRGVVRSWLGGGASTSSGTGTTATTGGCGWHAFDNTNAFAWIDGADGTVTARGKDGGSNFGAGFPAALASQAKNEGIYAAAFGNTTAGVTKALTIQATDSGGIYIQHDNSTDGLAIYDELGEINIDAGQNFGIRAGDTGLLYHKNLTGLNAIAGLALGTTYDASFPITIDSGLPSGSVAAVYYFAPTANGTVNLPALATHPVNPQTQFYRILFLRNIGSYFITLDANSAETIDGALTKVLCPGQSMILGAQTGTGAGWYTLSESQPKVVTSVTNTQFKALPTTALAILADPPAGFRLKPTAATVSKDFASGAYTNVNATYAALNIQTNGGSWIVNPIVNDTTTNPNLTDLTDFCAANARVVDLLPLYLGGAANDAAGALQWTHHLMTSAPTAIGGATNGGIDLTIDNNGSGDLTGGHANNTCKVTLYYVAEAL